MQSQCMNSAPARSCARGAVFAAPCDAALTRRRARRGRTRCSAAQGAAKGAASAAGVECSSWQDLKWHNVDAPVLWQVRQSRVRRRVVAVVCTHEEKTSSLPPMGAALTAAAATASRPRRISAAPRAPPAAGICGHSAVAGFPSCRAVVPVAGAERGEACRRRPCSSSSAACPIGCAPVQPRASGAETQNRALARHRRTRAKR